MKWIRRLLVAVVLAFFIAFAGIVALLRWGRDRADLPERIGETGIVQVRNFYVDLYGVKTSSAVMLFDAALETQGIAADMLLAELGAKREDVTHVFLTHGHADHYGSATLFPNAKIIAGRA